MKLSRRNFLKGILSTAGAAALVGPQVLEPVHGAHELTPQERDVIADVMGWRRKQWVIERPWPVMDITWWMVTQTNPILTGYTPVYGHWEFSGVCPSLQSQQADISRLVQAPRQVNVNVQAQTISGAIYEGQAHIVMLDIFEGLVELQGNGPLLLTLDGSLGSVKKGRARITQV